LRQDGYQKDVQVGAVARGCQNARGVSRNQLAILNGTGEVKAIGEECGGATEVIEEKLEDPEK
jgi:hypothetical protein